MDRDQAVPITENVAEPLECSPEVEVEDSGYSRTLQVHTSKYSGPIPPPETLEGYERLLPGAAERILTMAEQNAATIRDINTKQAAAEESTERNRHDEIRRGQLFGLTTVLTMGALAALALVLGHPVVAGTICSTTIIGVAAVFVTGRIQPDPLSDRRQVEYPDHNDG